MITRVLAVVVFAAATAAAEPITLQNATATRSQTVFGNWLVSETIDGNFSVGSGWAIAFGLEPFGSQTAVFETSSDLGFAGGTKLTFTLTQTYADSHTLGRFRISVTTDDRSMFANGLQTGGDVTANWVVLTPQEVSATGGAVLTIQADGSIRATGPNPALSIYTVVASTDLTGVTGIRLEALQDASLPFSGPGRATNGNFVLTEFQVDAVAACDEAETGDDPGCMPAPTNLSAKQVGTSGTQVLLTWDYGDDEIEGFEIDRRTPSGEWITLLNRPGSAERSYLDDQASEFRTYIYRMRAYKASVKSVESPEADVFQLRLYTERFNTQVFAIFKPEADEPLDATKFGYDHFNWISQITYVPISVSSNPAFTDRNGNRLNAPPPAITDPPFTSPLGGWPYLGADLLPYFWNEQEGFAPPLYSLASHRHPTFVDFNDLPSLPPYAEEFGDHYQFITSLVGVKGGVGTTSQSKRLASFTWSTNHRGVTGGVDFRLYNVEPPIESLGGGIFGMQVVGEDELPLGVRQALVAMGVEGVSTEPTVDRHAPLTAAFLVGTQGTNDWHTEPVVVTLVPTEIDGPSSVAGTSYSIDGGPTLPYAGAFTVSNDGEHRVEFQSVDKAGNVEEPRSVTVRIDQTPPHLVGLRSPEANANNWNSSPVTITFDCTDTVSGLAVGSPPASTVVSMLGAAQRVTGECADLAGNAASLAVEDINIDTAPPLVTFNSQAMSYTVDQQITIGCSATDALSGIASHTCDAATLSNVPAYTLGAGQKTRSASATDLAGNVGSASVSFSVVVQPGSLCTLTTQFVQSSSKYQALPVRQRGAVDKLASALCSTLATVVPKLAPAQKAKLVAAYQKGVVALAAGGWLTPTHATTLSNLAPAL